MKLNNPRVLKYAVILLLTQGWQKSQGVDFADTALCSAIAHFTVPLQNAHVDVFLVEEEWKDMVGYAKQYLNIVEDYPGSCSMLLEDFDRAAFPFTYVK